MEVFRNSLSTTVERKKDVSLTPSPGTAMVYSELSKCSRKKGPRDSSSLSIDISSITAVMFAKKSKWMRGRANRSPGDLGSELPEGIIINWKRWSFSLNTGKRDWLLPPTPAGVRAQHLRRLRETRVEQLWRCFRPESVTFDKECFFGSGFMGYGWVGGNSKWKWGWNGGGFSACNQWSLKLCYFPY